MPQPGPSVSQEDQRPPPRRGPLRRLAGRLVLALHRLADRLDLIPPEFGAESRIEAGDATAILAEWIRYLRFWAGYNPEAIFALKVGAALLVAAIVGLWLAIAFLL